MKLVRYYVYGIFSLIVFANTVLGNPFLIERDRVLGSELVSGAQSIAWTSTLGGVSILATCGSLLDLSGSEKIRLFELGSDLKLTEVYREPSADFLTSIPRALAWYQPDIGEPLLAIGGELSDTLLTGPQDLRLYRLETGPYGLDELYRVPISELVGVVQALDWTNLGGIGYLAVGGTFTGIGLQPVRLYRLVGDTLDEVYRVPATDLVSTALTVKWLSVKNERYLAVGGTYASLLSGTDPIRIYRLDPDTETLIEVFRLSASLLDATVNSLDWVSSDDGRYFLAAGSALPTIGFGGLDILRIFEFIVDEYGNAQLPQVSSISLGLLSGTVNAVAWHKFDENHFLLAASGALTDLSGNRHLRLLDFNPNSFTFSTIFASPDIGLLSELLTLDWHVKDANKRIKNEVLLAAGGEILLDILDPNGGDVLLYSLGFNTDLSVNKSVNNSTTQVGARNTFIVEVTNNGEFEAICTGISDVLPPNVTYISSFATTGSYDNISGIWSFESVAAGKTERLYITVEVNNGTPVGTVIENTATLIDPYNIDPSSINDADSASFTVASSLCDLGITKVADAVMVTEGGPVTFTVTVSSIPQ